MNLERRISIVLLEGNHGATQKTKRMCTTWKARLEIVTADLEDKISKALKPYM